MQILVTPHPFLKKQAKPIEKWDKKIDTSVKQMSRLLIKATDPKGVGLSATQVGLDKRLFLLYDEDTKKISIFVNPVIVKSSKKMLGDVYKTKKERWLEGCLSVPRIWGFVDRPYSVKVKYQTPVESDGSWQLTEKEAEYSDIESAYIQHEIDHLDGVLFTDHILKQGGTIYQEIDGKLTPLKKLLS